ncbi:histidinol dehydrogenase [Rubidibacter lacunae KORDI 51-2]|uniref:Histidinol dehydrogenase n=1 Tax=Rubidibacter lacunae KORDI 51-2 TaxID=582515 RepID=U5DTZ5_9CHRO|nr:histidinol dehydrogenase [Rubidibacter lacunae]ERN43150.1 histidinol dehydrogenase [Rubidibacter lacunae KORDI 51-2]
MLRIITNVAEARMELRRIGNRIRDIQIADREAAVRELFGRVRRIGDRAIFEAGAREPLRTTGSELDAAYQQLSKEAIDALRAAYREVEAFHRQQLLHPWVQFGAGGRVWGRRYQPVDCAGIYVDGGQSAGAATTIALAVPARIAGVARAVLVAAPEADGRVHPAVLVAAQEAGITEIYRVRGAAAIAALTYGTETIPAANAIAGVGDVDVALAKQLAYGTTGVDGLQGLTELAIVADDSADPAIVAADMLAEAERDSMAAAVLLTADIDFARGVQKAVEQLLPAHPRRTLAEKAIAHYGSIAVVGSMAEAIALANEFAPERLALAVRDPWALLESVRHAGTIFLGQETPLAAGDYLAGCDRALPASGGARYASGVGVETFLKASRLVQYPAAALEGGIATLATLADLEGRYAQVKALSLRQQLDDKSAFG